MRSICTFTHSCHQCNRATCVCCKYHYSVYMSFPIYCNSLGVLFIDMYSFILHTTVPIINCYECLKTFASQQASDQVKQQQAVAWRLLSSKKGFKIIKLVLQQRMHWCNPHKTLGLDACSSPFTSAHASLFTLRPCLRLILADISSDCGESVTFC